MIWLSFAQYRQIDDYQCLVTQEILYAVWGEDRNIDAKALDPFQNVCYSEMPSGSGCFTESEVLSFILEMWLSKPGVIGIPALRRG